MARKLVPVLNIWRHRNTILAVSLITASSVIGGANAQTVIIGGSGTSPVEVNMQALAPTYASPIVGGQRVQAGQQDFSKGSRIVYGGEVITLTPPGSKPKKKTKRVVTAKKAPTKKPDVKKAAVKKVEMAKIAPPKKQMQKVDAPKIATKAKPAVPATPAPTKTTMESAPEIKVAKQTPAPKAELAEKKIVAVVPKKSAAQKPKAITPTAPAKVEVSKPEKEIQVAAVAPKTVTKPLASSAGSAPSDAMAENQILFEPEQTKLPSSATGRLKKISSVLKSGNDRVQLVAYADANSNSAARRLSLGRALVVRSKLMALGVPNNKIEVRALGKPTDGSPADRVDLKLITR